MTTNLTLVDHYMIRRSKNRLVFRHYFSWISVFMVFAIFIFAAVSSTDLLDWRTNQSETAILKFSPLLLLFMALLPVFLVRSPHRTVVTFVKTIVINPFLTLFFLLAFPGALFARFVLKLQTTYFTQAFMILAFFCIVFIFLSLPESVWQKAKTGTIYVFGFIGFLASLVIIQNVLNNFHDTHSDVAILLVQAWVLAFLFLKGFKRVAILLILFFMVGLTFKNTAMLLLMIAVLGTAVLSTKVKWNSQLKRLMPLIIFTSSLVFLSVGTVFYLATRSLFSDGNTLFRFWIWEQRFQQFLESPLYGKLFTASTAIFFEPFKLASSADNLAPTHNDWLDVMVQGGIIGLILFFLAYTWPIVHLLQLRKKHGTSDKDIKIAVWAVLLLVNMAVAFTFNPFLLNPDISYILWFVAAYSLVLVHKSYQSAPGRIKNDALG